MYYNVEDFKDYFENNFEPWHFTSDDVDDLVCDIEKNFQKDLLFLKKYVIIL